MDTRILMLRLASGCAAAALAGGACADPPSLVGRISAVEGEVSFVPPGEDFWTEATRNFPVSAGESFWTGDAGRTELQVGSLEARLDSQTELDVLALDYGGTRLALSQGSIDLRLWRVPRGGVSIGTPAGDVHIDREGAYRIDVGAAPDDGGYPPVEVTVFDGAADVPEGDGFAPLEAGGAAFLYPGYQADLEDAQDASIDDWARSREAHERWDRQLRFSASLTGFEELEEAGDFVDTPDYGRVWFPRSVPADWAPYRDGHWAYVRPWGWTWIDDQPWGFAPFHYGRWAQFDGRWGWVPGQPTAEPVYAPALVAFVGGQGWSVSLSAGASAEAVGWVPLAPDEVYRPAYSVSPAYVRQVNITNVRETTINNITVNHVVNISQYRDAPAATVVRSDAFARGAQVQSASAPVSLSLLAHAPAATPATAPAPTREARAGGAIGAVVQHEGPIAAGFVAAPAPPPKLQAVRSALATQPPGANRPAMAIGARTMPPHPQSSGGPHFVAPAQLGNPTLQGRQPVTSATRSFPKPANAEGSLSKPTGAVTDGHLPVQQGGVRPSAEPSPLVHQAAPSLSAPIAPGQPAKQPDQSAAQAEAARQTDAASALRAEEFRAQQEKQRLARLQAETQAAVQQRADELRTQQEHQQAALAQAEAARKAQAQHADELRVQQAGAAQAQVEAARKAQAAALQHADELRSQQERAAQAQVEAARKAEAARVARDKADAAAKKDKAPVSGASQSAQ